MKKIILFIFAVQLSFLNIIAQTAASYESAAKDGDAKAQYNLGICYSIGKGVKKNLSTAFKWFEKSAEQGNYLAQYKVGLCYEKGEGVKSNMSKAFSWIMKSAENGYSEGQYTLGRYYEKGIGTNVDFSQAVLWYGRASEQGNYAATEVLNSSQYRTMYVSSKNPPSLEIIQGSIKFFDETGNNCIGANSKYQIAFDVRNTGAGDGYNCEVKVSLIGNKNAISISGKKIAVIKRDETQHIILPITTGFATENGKVEFSIRIDEPNGFGTDPQYLAVTTRAYDEPLMLVADYTLTNSAGNTTLKKKMPFDLQLLVQNVKQGKAEDVIVDVTVPSNVMLVEGNSKSRFSEVEGGETKSLVYSMIINNNYSENSVPIKVHISEKYGRYSEDKMINLSFDQTFASSKVSIEEKKQNRKDISLASLSSDVDKNIPEYSGKQTKTFAVIIANENYSQVSNVPFAINDGSTFREYCQRTLGLPQENVHFVADATLGELNHQIDWLKQVMLAFNGEAKVIFYYAGHGIPDESSKSSYLLPVDGYGNNVKSALSLEELYKSLASLPSESTIIFLDACFSGASREGGMLASARGVAIKAKQNQPTGKLIVFSAAQGDETALPYKEQYHGMFTYYLLKKIKETKGNVSLGELGDYIIDNVKKQSIVTNGKSQTPSITQSVSMTNIWNNLKLK